MGYATLYSKQAKFHFWPIHTDEYCIGTLFVYKILLKRRKRKQNKKNATVVEWMRMAEWGVPKHSIMEKLVV